jgi:hypothetical protein
LSLDDERTYFGDSRDVTQPSQIDFRIHAVRTGSDEARRVDFHRMISALVGAIYPTAILREAVERPVGECR